MKRRLPADSFEFYFSLGESRSHDAVAKHYKVSKRTVTSLAVKEDWTRRLSDLQRRARERSDEKILESIEDMNDRHLKTMRFLQRKALEALQTMRLTTPSDAVRALALGIDRERLIRGEPTDRTALDMEQLVRSEYERWMVKDGDDRTDDREETQPKRAVS